MKLTKEFLSKLLENKDGFLYRKKDKRRAINGDTVGCLHHSGYIVTKINKKQYGVHRVIFFIVNGFLPEEVDHIDGDRSNNKIENLRECTRQQNCRNRKISKRNTSGVKGVVWNSSVKKWQAQLTFNGKLNYLGIFNKIKDAKEAVDISRKRNHLEFFNDGVSLI